MPMFQSHNNHTVFIIKANTEHHLWESALFIEEIIRNTLILCGQNEQNKQCRLRLKRDGTRAETRFRLSPKRTSPFKLAGASVPSTAGSRGVCISVSNADTPRSEVVGEYWLHTPFASFPFTSPPVRHRASSGHCQLY